MASAQRLDLNLRQVQVVERFVPGPGLGVKREPSARGEPAPGGSQAAGRPTPRLQPLTPHAHQGKCRGPEGDRRPVQVQVRSAGKPEQPGEKRRLRAMQVSPAPGLREATPEPSRHKAGQTHAGDLVKAAPRNPIISLGTGITY